MGPVAVKSYPGKQLVHPPPTASTPAERAKQEIDYGSLLLTTRNFYFGGEHTNFRIPFEHVLSFRAHTDGLGLFRDTANAKAEVFTVLEPNPNGGDPVPARPIFGWFLFNMAHFLAQPEARELYATAKR